MTRQAGKVKKRRYSKRSGRQTQAPASKETKHGKRCYCQSCRAHPKKSSSQRKAEDRREIVSGLVSEMPGILEVDYVVTGFASRAARSERSYKRHHTPSRRKYENYSGHLGMVHDFLRRNSSELGTFTSNFVANSWNIAAAVSLRVPNAFNNIGDDRFQQVTVLWHGTPITNIESIALTGLRPGRKFCLLGSGVYLTPDLDKAKAYVGWGDYCALLICLARLGNVWDTNDATCTLNAQSCREHGCDSAFAGRGKHVAAWGMSLGNSEYCVYKSSRVAAAYGLIFSRK